MKLISVGNFEMQFYHVVNSYDLVITTKCNNAKTFNIDRVIAVTVPFSDHQVTGENAVILLKLLGVK